MLPQRRKDKQAETPRVPRRLPRKQRRALVRFMNKIRREEAKGSPPVDLSLPGPSSRNPQYSHRLTDADIPRIRSDWAHCITDIACPIPEELPPFRDINHEINLIDDSLSYNYHHPRCPEHFKPEFYEKVSRYVRAGWWIPQAIRQGHGLPMLCVAKKDKRLRTVFDCRQRNANTVKDATPFPDQDYIRSDVARSRYRSKIDMSEAYEQIRVLEKDVDKTGFSTIAGTFVSNVIQQGDCNAPSTFQRLMSHIFRDLIGRSVHCYLDDIFIYSDTIEAHQAHLAQVFKILREQHLFLSQKPEKVDLYSTDMDCLGYRIDDDGIHCDTTKLEKILAWPSPKSYHDVQRFNGLVNYISPFLRDIATWTGQLATICANQREFLWTPRLEECFQQIKSTVEKSQVLQPIDPEKEGQIFVICDASITGVGAILAQGDDWHTSRPAAFMSRRFSDAQYAYFTMEQEALAILEALKTWEDKLVGREFTIITDHEALKYLLTKKHLYRRQTRWIDYLSRFDYDIIHVPGTTNHAADFLSRYYENSPPNVQLQEYDFVRADRMLDPEGDDLPRPRALEIRRIYAARRRKLREAESVRHIEALELARGAEDDTPVHESIADGVRLTDYMNRYEEFTQLIQNNYETDPYFSKIIRSPDSFRSFSMQEGLLYHSDRFGNQLLCIPHGAILRGRRRLSETIIDHAHHLLGHLGSLRTLNLVRRNYWWPSMAKEIDEFCKTCGICQTTKASNKRPMGLLRTLPIPLLPWESVGMDFLGPFPPCEGFDYLLVIICRLTSMVQLIPTRTDARAVDIAHLYYRNVWALHGLPKSIVSDRDSKFTSAFWKELHAAIGTELLMSTAYHPQTDGATERANRTVAQILRAFVDPDQRNWVSKLPAVQYAINSSVSATTGFSPFELNYGYVPNSDGFLQPVIASAGVKAFAEAARWNLLEAHDHIIAARIQQTHQANRLRQPENEFIVGDLAYLATDDLRLPKSRARKLVPRFIGPYRVTEYYPRSHVVKLALPEELINRRIHNKFHVSRLRKAHLSDLEMFPHRDSNVFYDFGGNDELESVVRDILAHKWEGRNHDKLTFYVRYEDGDAEWREWALCEDLKALDDYLQLRGVENPTDLPKETSQRA